MSDDSDTIVAEVQNVVEDAPVVERDANEAPPEPTPEPVEPPIPKGVQKRIDRAVRQKYEAEARYKVLEEQLNAIKQSQAAKVSTDEPKSDDFQSYEDYLTAKAEYLAEKRVAERLSAYEQSQKEERAAAERNKTADSWNKRVATVTAELPDWADVIESSTDLPMTDHMSQSIMESEVGPKLAYYLAKHPDECADIAELSPLASVRALGRIEERIKSGALSAKTTMAPAPITPTGSKAKAEKSPSDMTDKEYADWRRDQIKRRR